jgi:hypothetical protein
MYERNLSFELVDKINGYEIYKCKAKLYDERYDKFVGRVKTYYDVCQPNCGDIIESRKTLKEAVIFARSI